MMRLLGMSLDLPEHHFDHMMTHPGNIVRLIYYPPQKPKESSMQDEEIGLGAHTDYECFTLLLADDTPGLEVLSPTPDASGRPKWISAPPHPESLTVNIADLMMRWTNGLYKSTIHRVVNRSPEKERYSVPFFFSINYDATVSTLPSCITTENPSPYPDIQAGPYTMERLRATLKEAADEYHKET
jgi:isopenicillin N synthase-like dioxygenase